VQPANQPTKPPRLEEIKEFLDLYCFQWLKYFAPIFFEQKVGLVEEFLKGLPLKKMESREYQVNAAKSILAKGNTLLIMPTALGKTFVAILVIAAILKKNPKAKILFLAPTKPLAVQQANRIKELVEIDAERVVVMTGEISPEKRKDIYGDAQVVSATPQTIANDLNKGIRLEEYSLIVFDETHRLVKNYAYTKIAREARRHPKILLLGLTASPSADEEKIKEVCEHLAIKNIEAKQESDADVKEYVHEIKVDWVMVELPQPLLRLKRELEAMAQEEFEKLKQYDYLGIKTRRPNKRHLLDLMKRLQRVAHPSKYRAVSLIAKILNLSHALDLVESQGVGALNNFLEGFSDRTEKSKAVAALAADPRVKEMALETKKLLEKGFEHPKKDRLIELVEERVQEGKSVIVFAHYRDSVKKIVDALNEKGIAAKQLIGKSKEGMSQKEQVGVLDEFREKRFDALVCTQVGEEGLDLPSVDSVIFFEAVPSEIRLIQRRGRTGRVRAGEAIILVTKDTKDEAYLWVSKKKEKRMKQKIEELKKELGGKNLVEEEETKEGELKQKKLVEY
jgi:Fanconi anemia group M protein